MAEINSSVGVSILVMAISDVSLCVFICEGGFLSVSGMFGVLGVFVSVVFLLEDSHDDIGPMDQMCQYCQEMKLKKETPHRCCTNGKININPFPVLPSYLWICSG